MTADAIATLGLALDIIGVILIWKFDPGKRLSIPDSTGKYHMVSLGTGKEQAAAKLRLSGWGMFLITLGFFLQGVALWIP